MPTAIRNFFADDVKCSHGVVDKLDETVLSMQARGILKKLKH
jgi:hypothetical protein